jgi:pyruvate dehydrogenase E2 component (dihydrolipoamide acetyltransferase)
MAKEIRLPKLGQTMEEGTVISCLVAVNEEIKRGQVIFEIETDKATLEMESPVDGFVKNILVNIGQTLPVNEPMMIVGGEDEQVPQNFIDGLLKGAITEAVEQTKTAEVQIHESPSVVTSSIPPQVAAEATTVPSPAASTERIFASPRARAAAKERGVSLAGIQGTGPGERITEEDVRNSSAAVQMKTFMPQAGSEIPLTKMRRAIGANLQRSWQQSPHFNVAMSINMTQAMNFRQEFNRNRPKSQQLSVNDLVVKACAMTLRRYPAVNSSMADDKTIWHLNINIGIATAVPDGLVVPVLVDADKRNWDELQSLTKQMVAEARKGKIIGMGKGTFTISNLGMFGVDYFTAIVNPPECAILAVGSVADKPTVINKVITIVPMMEVVLCSDHRIIDGATAAQFLKALKEYLEQRIE